jgi:hypothetical protein
MKKMISCLLTLCFSLSAAPQAIVFDFGDVLTTKPNTEEIRHFLRTSFHLNKDEFIKVNQLKYDLIEKGKTNDRDFWIQYAKDIIFIDDLQVNVDGAKKQGIDAILFTSQEQLEKELQNRGLLD